MARTARQPKNPDPFAAATAAAQDALRNPLNLPPLRRWKVADLRPAQYNPRKISAEDRAQLEASLDTFGVVEPLVVNAHPERRGVIIGGHQRFGILRERGQTEVDVIEVELDEAAERELNVRLNQNTGEWDWKMLQQHFQAPSLLSWGFSPRDLASWPKAEDLALDGADGEDDDLSGEGGGNPAAGDDTVRVVQLFPTVAEHGPFYAAIEAIRTARPELETVTAVVLALAQEEAERCASTK